MPASTTNRTLSAKIASPYAVVALSFLGITACAASPKDRLVTAPPNVPPAASTLPKSATIPVASNGTPPETAPVDEWQHHREPERDAKDEDVEGLPNDLVSENVRTTPITVLARVTAGKIWRHPDYPKGSYVNHIYQADVIEVFRGQVASKITYSVMADADLPLHMPAYPVVLSLCGEEPKGYFVPDNGYQFPAAPKVLREARASAARKSTHTHPATACE